MSVPHCLGGMISALAALPFPPYQYTYTVHHPSVQRLSLELRIVPFTLYPTDSPQLPVVLAYILPTPLSQV